jgi:hypothetical protein
VDNLALVVGGSMGAQQTYEWAVHYPIWCAAPIAGTAKNTMHDFLFTETLVDAIASDPGFNNGFYTSPTEVREGLPNDLFVVRVAGNGLGHDVLGSLSYALEHLRESLRLVVILGHSGCGAVSAAVDAFLHPLGYLSVSTSYSLRCILDRLLIVVEAASRKLAATYGSDVAKQPGYRDALIAASVAGNAAQVAFTVQRELTALGL